MTRKGPRPPSQRQLRVGESIRHALAETLARGDLRDPALAGRSITVTEVRATPDLRNAKVYVMPLGGASGAPSADDKEIAAALQRSAAWLRALVNEAVPLKFSPKLDFVLDPTFEAARRIQQVLDAPEVARDLGAADDPSS